MYEDADEPGEDGGEHENGSTPMEESWNIFIESTKLHYWKITYWMFCDTMKKLSDMNSK